MTHLFRHTNRLVRHDAPYNKPGTYFGTIPNPDKPEPNNKLNTETQRPRRKKSRKDVEKQQVVSSVSFDNFLFSLRLGVKLF